MAIGWYDTTSQVLSVTDNRGNNYQRVAGPTTQAQAGTQSITTHPTSLPPRPGTTITVTFNAAVNYPDVASPSTAASIRSIRWMECLGHRHRPHQQQRYGSPPPIRMTC